MMLMMSKPYDEKLPFTRPSGFWCAKSNCCKQNVRPEKWNTLIDPDENNLYQITAKPYDVKLMRIMDGMRPSLQPKSCNVCHLGQRLTPYAVKLLPILNGMCLSPQPTSLPYLSPGTTSERYDAKLMCSMHQ